MVIYGLGAHSFVKKLNALTTDHWSPTSDQRSLVIQKSYDF
jgi:hypothetical protein